VSEETFIHKFQRIALQNPFVAKNLHLKLDDVQQKSVQIEISDNADALNLHLLKNHHNIENHRLVYGIDNSAPSKSGLSR
jgi:hypothetical protein